MKTTEFDNLTAEGLAARIQELKQEYFALHTAVLAGKEKNSAALQPKRRNIARAKTRLAFLRTVT